MGLLRAVNLGPLAPAARIIPLDQAAMFACNICEFEQLWATFFFSSSAVCSLESKTKRLVGITRDTMPANHFLFGDGRGEDLLARRKCHRPARGDRRALSLFCLRHDVATGIAEQAP